MNYWRRDAECFSEGFTADLTEFMTLQEATGFKSGIAMDTRAGFPGKVNVEGLLKKAGEIAGKYHPQSFSIAVGTPFGAQVSFTWPTTHPD